MTLELVKVLLSRMPYISNVCIMGLCEPFMNPEAPAIVKWLKSQGYFISLTTNGMVSLTGERLDCLRCVDDFVISIDTDDPETFSYLRGGAKLPIVMENFRRVIEMKRSLGLGKKDNPPLHINAVITSLNFHQIPSLIKMLEPYADDLTYLMVDPVSRPDYQKFEDPLAIKHDAKFEAQICELRKIARQSRLSVVGLDYMLTPSYHWRDCPISWLNIWVQPNGDIYNCYAYEYVVGNAFKDNPLRAQNSKKARDFRKRLLTNDPPLQQCRCCNFARPGWQLSGVYLTGHKDVIEDAQIPKKLYTTENIENKA
jgi:radical SAM protein with 4Fe4S-binding SPASM domain